MAELELYIFQLTFTSEVIWEFWAAFHNVSSNWDIWVDRLQQCEHLHIDLAWKKKQVRQKQDDSKQQAIILVFFSYNK